MFSLRFSEDTIEYWANRNPSDLSKLEQIGRHSRTCGHLTQEEFVTICETKSPRSKWHFEKNTLEYIREVTNVSFTTSNERLRIEVLTLLDGVAWPMASYLLHFCGKDPYPILDFRALWSLSMDVPKAYDFPFWWAYTEYCRSMASRHHVSMRVLDRALWQYSVEEQR